AGVRAAGLQGEMLCAKREQRPVQLEAVGMSRRTELAPSKPARLERLVCLRIGNALGRAGRAESRKIPELASSSLDDLASEIRLEVGEEQKRRAGRPFLAHEKQRRHRRHEQDDDRE